MSKAGDIISAVGGPVASIGSSILGGIFGSKSQSDANKTNMAINQQNLNFQREMFNRQMQYNMEMFDKQNEWNSAQQQVKRFLAAGLNPAVMMQGQSAGVAQSANGVSSPSGSTTQVGAFDPTGVANQVGTSVVSALNNFSNIDAQKELRAAETESMAAEAALKRIDAQTRLTENLRKIENMEEDTRGKYSNRYLTDMKSLYTDQLYELGRATFGDSVAKTHEEALSVRQDRINKEAQEIGIRLDNGLKGTQLQYADKMILADLALKVAQRTAFAAGAGLSLAQAKYVAAQELETVEKTAGIKLDNKQKAKIMPLLFDEQKYKTERAKNNVGSDNAVQVFSQFGHGFLYNHASELGNGLQMYLNPVGSALRWYGEQVRKSAKESAERRRK